MVDLLPLGALSGPGAPDPDLVIFDTLIADIFDTCSQKKPNLQNC